MKPVRCYPCVLVCLLMAALVLYLLHDPDLSYRLSSRLGLDSGRPEISRFYRNMVWLHKQSDPQVPSHSVLFIGDSITQALVVSRVAACGVNYGIAGDTTAGVLQRLQVYNSLKSAAAVVLAVGVNDLKYRNNDQILANYRSILSRLPPGVPIIFSAIHPVNDKLRGSDWSGRIAGLNASARDMCADMENCHFSSIFSELSGDTGELAADYHVGDGLHLSRKAYSIWSEELAGQLAAIDPGNVAGGDATCVYNN